MIKMEEQKSFEEFYRSKDNSEYEEEVEEKSML